MLRPAHLFDHMYWFPTDALNSPVTKVAHTSKTIIFPLPWLALNDDYKVMLLQCSSTKEIIYNATEQTYSDTTDYTNLYFFINVKSCIIETPSLTTFYSKHWFLGLALFILNWFFSSPQSFAQLHFNNALLGNTFLIARLHYVILQYRIVREWFKISK